VTRDQLIETMARGIYDAECPTGRLWTDRADGTRGTYIALATAALTAIEAAGMQAATALVAAHAAGREAGMRAAAGILEGYAVNPTCAGRLGATRIVAVDHAIQAILSAIGPQEDSTSE
jgi:hypothetical protein